MSTPDREPRFQGQDHGLSMVACHDCGEDVYIGAWQSDATPAEPGDDDAGYRAEPYWVRRLILCALCALRREVRKLNA